MSQDVNLLNINIGAFQEVGGTATMPLSIFSQLYHLIAFQLKQASGQLDTGMFIVSVDIDVGDRKLGLINRGKNDANVNRYWSEYTIGKIEELALPLFVDLFNDLEIPATFAVRGQLTEIENAVLQLLLDSSVDHDIGAHGFFHRKFKTLAHSEADSELRMVSAGMRKFNITPRSFVFPGNSIAHLDLLEKHGYRCYRGYGDFLNDRMHIEKRGQLFNIHPSLYIDEHMRYSILRHILNISTARRASLHIWFHLWNFGATRKTIEKGIQRILIPLLKDARTKEETGLLTFDTMISAVEKVQSTV